MEIRTHDHGAHVIVVTIDNPQEDAITLLDYSQMPASHDVDVEIDDDAVTVDVSQEEVTVEVG